MNIFSNAKSKGSTTTRKTGAAKKETKKVVAQIGLVNYAAACAAEKAAKELKEIYETPLKDKLTDKFVEFGMATGEKPPSFKAVETLVHGAGQITAEGTITLALRGSDTALSADDCELLTTNGIPYTKTDVVVETYYINKEYIHDTKLMKKVSAVLAGIDGLPEDFILHQSEKKATVTAETVDAIFKLKSPTIVKALLAVATKVAIRPKINGPARTALKIIEALVGNKPRRGAKS